MKGATMSEETPNTAEQTSEPEQNVQTRYTLPVQFYVPDNIVPRYVTNITVQPFKDEFIVSFYEAYPPLLLGTPEQNDQKINEMPGIVAKCVSQIIVSANRFPNFAKAMTDAINLQVEFQEGTGKEE
jgi:hypothetical protein